MQITMNDKIHEDVIHRIQSKSVDQKVCVSCRIKGHLSVATFHSIERMNCKLLLDTGMLASIVVPICRLNDLASLEEILEIV